MIKEVRDTFAPAQLATASLNSGNDLLFTLSTTVYTVYNVLQRLTLLCPPNLSGLTTFLGDRFSHIRWLKPTIFVLL